MNAKNETVLASTTDTGSTGIYQLKRIWSKAMAGTSASDLYAKEWELDNALMNILGLGLLPTFRFLYEQQPGFEAFEQWVTEQCGGSISAETKERCNALVDKTIVTGATDIADTLTAEDIAFWEEQGYVIIRNAVSKEDCTAARKAIMEWLGMDEADSKTWYRNNPEMQGIMVLLYREAAIDKNRNAVRIRRAFEQLWNKTGLAVTTDKCGFNPPETDEFKYRGIGLHWDVSLATPIPFGTQGILYLTDTAAHQGALTVVPGFHKHIEDWLASLPAGTNPRETDFSVFGPKPIAANAGDFIIWDHKLPHGSSPNRAHSPRIVQYINWFDPLQKTNEQWI